MLIGGMSHPIVTQNSVHTQLERIASWQQHKYKWQTNNTPTNTQ
jgi:hypothetical protein